MRLDQNQNFISIKPVYVPETWFLGATSHADSERHERLKVAQKYNKGMGINQSFLVDKGHPNGKEVHCVTENGIIFIINERTKLLITVLLARPNQVKRLYESCGMTVPSEMLTMCRFYSENNLNN